MKDHHLQLNLAKTELLVVSANPSFHHNFTFQLGSSTITPSKTAGNLIVVFDDKLNFTDHITKTARSFRFALYNIKKIRPFLSEHATQHLVVTRDEVEDSSAEEIRVFLITKQNKEQKPPRRVKTSRQAGRRLEHSQT